MYRLTREIPEEDLARYVASLRILAADHNSASTST